MLPSARRNLAFPREDGGNATRIQFSFLCSEQTRILPCYEAARRTFPSQDENFSVPHLKSTGNTDGWFEARPNVHISQWKAQP